MKGIHRPNRNTRILNCLITRVLLYELFFFVVLSPEKLMDLKQDKNDILKPKLPPATPKPTKQERKTTPAPATNGE